MQNRFKVCASVAMTLGIALNVPLAAAASKKGGNPLGVVVVRFHKGLGSDQMKAAITQAGGEVVSDLSKLDRMAAVPASSEFATKIKSHPLVVATWADKVYSRPSTDVASEDAGVVGKNDPQLGNPGPNGPPDPWHDLSQQLHPLLGKGSRVHEQSGDVAPRTRDARCVSGPHRVGFEVDGNDWRGGSGLTCRLDRHRPNHDEHPDLHGDQFGQQRGYSRQITLGRTR